jgi:superfamily II DNA or RNA helicase
MRPIYSGPGAVASTEAGEGIAERQRFSNSTPRHAAPELRPYQDAVIDRVADEIAAGRHRVLIVAPTGSGKTVIAAAINAAAAKNGRRILIIAHRREIISQTARKLHEAGVDAGIIQAGFPPRPGQSVQVASIQTLHARAIRSSAIEMPPADILIIDEAHHARAETYQAVIDAYPGAIVIGMTATPCRRDGRGLGNIFDALVECPQVAALVEQGYLVPSRVYAPSTPDLDGVRVERGDYVQTQLTERVNRPELVGDIGTHWLKLSECRPTVCFATSVEHSVAIRNEFRRLGVMAEHIDGGTPADERDAVLKGLTTGAVELVTNCAVLTEGWDCPDIGCLILARPTKSLGLFRQMVGRALRPAPGKSDAIILDHSGAVFLHGLPEDDIAWTLDIDGRAVNRTHAARSTQAPGPALVDCPECHAVRTPGKPCVVCGWAPRTKGAAVDVIDGDLGLVRRDRRVLPSYASDDERRLFYQQLMAIAARRGYSPGFAYFKYQEKFNGAKPPWSWRSLPPVEPEPHVLAWVRSRAIAYARARSKGAA